MAKELLAKNHWNLGHKVNYDAKILRLERHILLKLFKINAWGRPYMASDDFCPFSIPSLDVLLVLPSDLAEPSYHLTSCMYGPLIIIAVVQPNLISYLREHSRHSWAFKVKSLSSQHLKTSKFLKSYVWSEEPTIILSL